MSGAPQPHKAPFTAKDLLALPTGQVLKDVVGDRWTKQPSGRWVCFDANLTGESLLHVWGPLTLTGEQA